MSFEETLESAKRQSTAQLLMRCARLVNETALARVEEQQGMPLRPAHTTLFLHIDLEGTRLTELARRVGVTKQAVGQLVDDLERMGTVERVPDPSDGRAKLVVWTERGRASLLDGLALLRTLEGELRGVVGGERWETFHEVLLLLNEHLDPRD